MNANLSIPKDEIADFCRHHHIRRLSLFGSVLTGEFRPDSDIDVLVEFEEGKTPGWEIVSMEDEFSQIIGRKADLHTSASLSPYFRDEVLAEAEDQYVAP